MSFRIILIILLACFVFGVSGQSGTRPTFDEIRDAGNEYYRAHKNESDKRFRRLEYYLESRTMPDGTIPGIDRMKWDANKQLQKQERHTQKDQQRSYSGDWNLVGPVYVENENGIGRVNRIAFHPTDTAIIYAATAGGGLWYTTNHGTFWWPITESLPVNNLSGVAIHPDNPDTIYILTGDGDGASSSFSNGYSLSKPSIGVLKTYDHGTLWQPTGLVFNEQNQVLTFDLKMDPSDPETMFVSTNIGLFKTNDGGNSWDTLFNYGIWEVEFRPGDPDKVYAVSDSFFYRSNDGGDTWPDSVLIPAIAGSFGRMGIATCSSNDQLIYLIASPTDTTLPVHRGLYRSLNGGDSFSLMSNTPNILKNSMEPGSQADYDLAIACNPLDQSDVAVSTVGNWKSVDNGSTFDPAGGTHADIHDLVTNPLTDNLYAATDGGIFYSNDFGDSWTFISEWMRITQYYKIGISQQDGDVVIGGTQDNGTNRNENGDAVFDKILPKDGMDCAVHPLNDDLMVYSAQFGEFWISTDGGNNRDSLIFATSVATPDCTIWVTPVALDPDTEENMYIGYNPVYRSNDGGATFTAIPDTVSGRRLLHCGTGGRLYASDRYSVGGSRVQHMWTSGDGGDSWEYIHRNANYPDTTYVITGVTTDPSDPDEVWITVGGWDAEQKVYRSVDAGQSWTNKTDNLPNIPVNCIVYQGGGPAGAVYVGTDLGVFYRNDDLGSWIYFSNRLPKVEITDLEIQYEEGRIVAGTFGRGIWESDLFTNCTNIYMLPGVQQITGQSYFFQASDWITSEAVIDGMGSEVIYRAANFTILEEGFRARSQNGAFFRSLTGGCGEGLD